MPKRGGWDSTGFGARLRELREAKGLSQEKLASEAGVTLGTVSRLERGLSEPAWPIVLALAEILEVSTDSFKPIKKEGEG